MAKLNVLEAMLRGWEDFWLVTNLRYKALKGLKSKIKVKPQGGPIFHWRDMRKCLLDSVHSKGVGHSTSEFLRILVSGNESWKSFQPMGDDGLTVAPLLQTFPFVLYNWMHQSRRVFSLDKDLQALLNATSLEGIMLRDLRFPFESFALELSQPIHGRGGFNYSFMLFSTGLSTLGLCEAIVLLIDQRVASYKPLSPLHKNNFNQLLKRKQWAKLQKALKKQADPVLLTLSEGIEGFAWAQDINDAQLVGPGGVFSLDCPLYLDKGACRSALRILAGVCLYIKSLPVASPHMSDWKSIVIPPNLPGSTIVDEAQVCQLSSKFSLSPQDRNLLSDQELVEKVAGAHEKSPHFRRGFWRRPPGRGNDSSAEKTVWVPPTIIRRDLLGPGELPLGAETILFSEKKKH